MKRTFKIKLKSDKMYVRLLNGMFQLTDKEMEVLVEFIKVHKEYKGVNVFTSEFKKLVAKRLEMGNFNLLNTYIKVLTQKNALIKSQSLSYAINPVLLIKPGQTAIEFNWE